MQKFIELFGWISVGLILLAYGLVTAEFMESQSATYQGMNAAGAVGLIASSYDNKDWQPIVLNGVWLCIALFGLATNL